MSEYNQYSEKYISSYSRGITPKTNNILRNKYIKNKFHEEGIVRERRNYTLFQSIDGTQKEEQIESPKLKVKYVPPKVIDNYQYRESIDIRKKDKNGKSLVYHKRKSAPKFVEGYEEYMNEGYDDENFPYETNTSPIPKTTKYKQDIYEDVNDYYPTQTNYIQEEKYCEEKKEPIYSEEKNINFNESGDNCNFKESKCIKKTYKPQPTTFLIKRSNTGEEFQRIKSNSSNEEEKFCSINPPESDYYEYKEGNDIICVQTGPNGVIRWKK